MSMKTIELLLFKITRKQSYQFIENLSMILAICDLSFFFTCIVYWENNIFKYKHYMNNFHFKKKKVFNLTLELIGNENHKGEGGGNK